MSLSHEILDKASPVRQFIDDHFVFQPLSRTINKGLKGLPFTSPGYPNQYLYTVAGTATDLMIRCLFDIRIHEGEHVRRIIHHLGCIVRKIIPFDGPGFVNPWTNGNPFDVASRTSPKTQALVDAFEAFVAGRTYTDFRDDERLRLARFCILFARIDHFRRGGGYAVLFPLADLPLEVQLIDAPSPDLERDVATLVASFRLRHADLVERSERTAFGRTLAGSADVNGADFDFVADGTLFEVKTTIKPTMSVDMMRQAVGYWLLDYDVEFGIRRLTIDLTRHGALREIDVRETLMAPAFRAKPDADIRFRFRKAIAGVRRSRFGSPTG